MSQNRKKNRTRAKRRKQQLAQVYKRRKAHLKQQRKKELKQRRSNFADQHKPQREMTVEPTEQQRVPQEVPALAEPEQTEPERAPQEVPVLAEPEQTEPERAPQEMPVLAEPEQTEPERVPQEIPVLAESEQTEPEHAHQETSVSVEPEQTELESERTEPAGKGKCSRKRNRCRSGRDHAGKVFQRVLQTAVMCLMVWGLFLEARPKVVEELTIEAGGDLPELSEFMLRDVKHAAFETELEKFVDLHEEADYEVGIMISGSRYTVSLHVVDTTAPVVVTQDARIYNDETLEPADLIRSIDDATKTTVEFAEEPDFTVPGDWEIMLLVTDAGGNSTRASALVEIIADTEPPVIEGVEDLSVAVGKSISYKKNVTVTDDHSEHVTLTVDSSAVNLNKAGTYEVIYIAEDEAGNVTKVSATVRVKAPGVQSATDEMVYAKADEILAGILTPGMSQYEKAQAIFNWVHNNIAYSDGTPKTSYVQGAYRGLFERKGDCFVYAASSKYLLNRAGITNMDIGFVNPARIHYWNLIDLGEGWYHFDTTRRADGSSFFYASDAEISAYSSTHNGSHAYDPSQYPQIQ